LQVLLKDVVMRTVAAPTIAEQQNRVC
jgi:hypothetical protein